MTAKRTGLGYGITPLDISIQNWAIKLAKQHMMNIITAKRTYASGTWIGQKAREMVKADPKWIELARKRVMKQPKPKTGGWENGY
jgi:hypothetical protein